MSTPGSTNPKSSLLGSIDVYTVMLGVSLVAVILAVTLLALEHARYSGQPKPSSAPAAQLSTSNHSLTV